MRLAWTTTTAVCFALCAAHADEPAPPLSPGERVLAQTAEELAAPPPPPPPLEFQVQQLPPPERSLVRKERPSDDYWSRTIARDDIFSRGQWSLTYLTGYLGINLGPLFDIPFEMLPQLVRLNCMWNRPWPNRFMRGSWEGIAEVTCLPVTNGPATIVIGGSLMLRYNFGTWKNRRWNPYFQMGGGGSYTDEWLYNSPLLSSGFEFILQNAIGINVRLSDRLSLNGEWAYIHLSNGGIVMPNISVNQIGGLVGLTYYFGRRKDKN